VASKQAWIDYKTPRTSHNVYRINRLWHIITNQEHYTIHHNAWTKNGSSNSRNWQPTIKVWTILLITYSDV
jgi:hypothetical protein